MSEDKRTRCGTIDCSPPVGEPTPETLLRLRQVIDYMAKDYDSLQRGILDLLPTRVPGWVDRTEADLGMAILELFAYEGDRLSYYQDRVAGEGHLGPATLRDSVRRHLGLINYRLDPGRTAEVLLQFRVRETWDLPTDYRVATDDGRDGRLVFEPAASQVLLRSLNGMALAADAPVGASQVSLDVELDEEHLPAGSRLWFSDGSGGEWVTLAEAAERAGGTTTLVLAEPLRGEYPATVWEETGDDSDGQQLIVDLEQPGRIPGSDAGLNTEFRVRVDDDDWGEVRDLRTSGPDDRHFSTHRVGAGRTTILFGDGTHGRRPGAGGRILVQYLAVRGNAVAATHGESQLQTGGGTGEAGQVLVLARGPLTILEGAADLTGSPVEVRIDDVVWQEVEDFVASGPTDRHYRMVLDDDGWARLQFGDGNRGQVPDDGAAIVVDYRAGNGEAGLVGPRSIVVIECPDDTPDKIAVVNPESSFGGRDPENRERAKIQGPYRIREHQDRAVVPADYERLALEGVELDSTTVVPHHARARFEWNGSWHDVVVSVDLPGREDLPPDHPLLAAFRARLAVRKLAGYGLAVEPARYAPLHVSLTAEVDARHFARDVRGDLETVLGAGRLLEGGEGFFAPGRFGFGEAVKLSDLYAVAMAVSGVVAVRVDRFKRLGDRHPDREADGAIPVGDLEIARCDGDPRRPEDGILTVRTVGGKEG